jgi:hypothetical protein
MRYANRSYLNRRRTPAEACGGYFMAGNHRRRMRHDGVDCVLVSFRRAVTRRHFGPSCCRRPAIADTRNQPHSSARRICDDRGRGYGGVERCRAHNLDRGADGIGGRRQIVDPVADPRPNPLPADQGGLGPLPRGRQPVQSTSSTDHSFSQHRSRQQHQRNRPPAPGSDATLAPR